MQKNIKMPNIWGQGALFAYSGFEGECSYYDSLCATLLGDSLGIQFRNLASQTDRAYFKVRLQRIFNIYYTCVISDTILADIRDTSGETYPLKLVFTEQSTVVFESRQPSDAVLEFEYGTTVTEENGVRIYEGNGNKFAYVKKTDGEKITVAVSYGESCAEKAKAALQCDLEEMIAKRMSFYESLPRPEFSDEAEERLYYKCASILRSTVYTPEGKIDYMALTPDRFPHRAIWLWDTAYLIIGMKYLSSEVSKQAVKAILQCRHEDGFLPHMTTPSWQSNITQPPVLAWAALELYRFDSDREFLASVFDGLAAYIEWDLANRDLNGNGLPEWVVNEADPFCKCDESGMDNTPRFDEAGEMDCIDFAAFLASDMKCLAEIAEILGRTEDKAHWEKRFSEIREKINTVLWDEEDGFYYDKKLCDGQFHKVKSVASFITLFAGVADREKAAKMVEHLKNPCEFGTPFPVPTVSADDKTYATRDMFRGTVWLNFNYLISRGLDDYGYHAEAEELRQKTIQTIKHWYLNDGVVYEFYDSMDEFSPCRLSRKGIALQPYMPELRYQSVRDFSWGACAVMDFLNNNK